MKTIKRVLLTLVLAISLFTVNAQGTWISSDVFTPARVDTQCVFSNGTDSIIAPEALTTAGLYIQFHPSYNSDSINIGVLHLDSTQVLITDVIDRRIITNANMGVVVENGFKFTTTDKAILENWLTGLYPMMKAASEASIKANYKPHKF